MYLIQKNMLGENTEQAEYAFVVVFTDIVEIFLDPGKCLVDKISLHLRHETMTRITWAQLPVFTRGILKYQRNVGTETLRREEHCSYTACRRDV